MKIHEYYQKVENDLKRYFNFFNKFQNKGNIEELEKKIE